MKGSNKSFLPIELLLLLLNNNNNNNKFIMAN